MKLKESWQSTLRNSHVVNHVSCEFEKEVGQLGVKGTRVQIICLAVTIGVIVTF